MTPKTTLHLTLKSTLESVGVKLRLRGGKPEWRSGGLSVPQRDWLARHQDDVAQGLVESVVADVFSPPASVSVLNGPEAGVYWSEPSDRPVADPAVAYWRAMAVRVLAGEFDTPARRGGSLTPPTGSLAKSLVIGLQGQAEHSDVRKALDYLNRVGGHTTTDSGRP